MHSFAGVLAPLSKMPFRLLRRTSQYSEEPSIDQGFEPEEIKQASDMPHGWTSGRRDMEVLWSNSGRLLLCDPCGLWAAAPGSPYDRVGGCARGRRALSFGRAGGRSGLRARRCLPLEKAVLLSQDWESNAFAINIST
jgi:hypothetical protein